MYCVVSFILNLFLVVTAPQWNEVRSAPMTKPDHVARWHEVMHQFFGDQEEHIVMTQQADGTSKATLNGLVWQGKSVTTSDAMPFCQLGNRLYLIGHPGLRSFHVQVDTMQFDTKANAPIDLGRYSILVFNEKVARIAFPIHGRMVYGHRIGMLYTDEEDNIWEEVWRNAKQIHEEKETRMHHNNMRGGERVDTYRLDCSLGKVEAEMVHTANAKKASDKREKWSFQVNAKPYVPKEDDVEQSHYPYLEINFRGAALQVVFEGIVIAESDDDSKPLYIAYHALQNKLLELYLTPDAMGDVDLKSLRIVECVHEFVQ